MTETKKCRVCGKEYTPCHTHRTDISFRWQEVACSPECGTIYFAKVLESRGEPSVKPVSEENIIVDEDPIVEPESTNVSDDPVAVGDVSEPTSTLKTEVKPKSKKKYR